MELNLARNSPIIEPIFDIDISTPVKNTASPNITPTHPRRKLTSNLLSTPTKKLRINTRRAIGTTAFALFFISSKNILLTSILFIEKEAIKRLSLLHGSLLIYSLRCCNNCYFVHIFFRTTSGKVVYWCVKTL